MRDVHKIELILEIVWLLAWRPITGAKREGYKNVDGQALRAALNSACSVQACPILGTEANKKASMHAARHPASMAATEIAASSSFSSAFTMAIFPSPSAVDVKWTS